MIGLRRLAGAGVPVLAYNVATPPKVFHIKSNYCLDSRRGGAGAIGHWCLFTIYDHLAHMVMVKA